MKSGRRGRALRTTVLPLPHSPMLYFDKLSIFRGIRGWFSPKLVRLLKLNPKTFMGKNLRETRVPQLWDSLGEHAPMFPPGVAKEYYLLGARGPSLVQTGHIPDILNRGHPSAV